MSGQYARPVQFSGLGAAIDRPWSDRGGAWPAFGEIDILENLGAEPGRVFGAVHCPIHFGNGALCGEDLDPGHSSAASKVVAVDWTRDSIVWSVDGREYFSLLSLDIGSSWVFDHPFYLLINLAVGGERGGPVDRATSFPAELIVD